MTRPPKTRNQVALAFGAAGAFMLAAIIEACAALLGRVPGIGFAAAAMAVAGLVWLIVALQWRRQIER